MKPIPRLVFLLSIIFASAISVMSQEPPPKQPNSSSPFADLDNQLKKQGGWNKDKQRPAELFNIERKRLGDRFEPELMKYLGQDFERHYWISTFLEDTGYLQGAPRMPHLSLLIKHQAIALLEGKADMESMINTVSVSVTAAVLSEQLGLHKLAVSHKTRAEGLIQKDDTLVFGFPAMSEQEGNLYESLPFKNEAGGKSQTIWRANDANHYSFSREPQPKKVPVSPQTLQERVIKKTPPVYPAEAQGSGVAAMINIQILISEEGRVIETIAEGPEQFLEAAIEAARQWTFKPMIIEGKAVRMSGLLSFNLSLK
jgi:TonB family protein